MNFLCWGFGWILMKKNLRWNNFVIFDKFEKFDCNDNIDSIEVSNDSGNDNDDSFDW